MNPVKFPAIRQPAVEDYNGRMVFTRPWYLFFQSLYTRGGGAIDTGDDGSLEPIGNSTVESLILSIQQDIAQNPIPVLQSTVEELSSMCAEQRDQIAELRKEIDSLKQGNPVL